MVIPASADGQLFDLGRFAGRPPLLLASEVLASPMGLKQRKAIWRGVGVLPALTMIAGLFADLDLAVVTDTRSEVERAFVHGYLRDIEAQLVGALSRGRVVFSNVGLVQCIKEVVEFADEHSDRELSVLDLTRCVLGINQDNDQVDAGIAARATNPQGHDTATRKADFLELAVDFVAQSLFDHSDSLETLACSVEETWRRGWASGTQHKVIHDFGSGPADVFAEVVGIDLDDFLALAWFFWNAARAEGQVGFDSGLLAATGLGPKVIETFLQQCSLPISELRDRFVDERLSDAATPWMRYTLQEFPFLRLEDGSVLMLRLQYAVQRMFGDLLYLKVHDALEVSDSKRADRFKSAMNTMFEYRVGSVLDRMAQHENHFGGTVVITEEEMKAAWSNSRGEHPKICDYAYLQGGEAILIDANNRNLPKKFADRSAVGSDLHAEIRDMFAGTKFKQLTSTAQQFRSSGWTATSGTRITTETKFIPFVVAPVAGIPSNEFTEMLILEQALPLIRGFDSKVLPPTIMTWRDLQILEGIAERAEAGRVIELLIMWRISNYEKQVNVTGFPMALSDFIDHHFTLGRTMSTHDKTVGAALLEELRQHAIRRLEESEQQETAG